MNRFPLSTLANLLDLMLDAVCLVDVDGHFVFVSAAGERIFGYTPEEMVGMSMIELVHPADRERTLRAAAAILGGEPNPHFQNRYVRKDGSTVHIMWSARWSPADQLRIAVARDVTELKRAESMQAALHHISEAAHSAEDLLDMFGRIHRIIGELMPAANFFVALYDAPNDRLSFPYFVDERERAPPPCSLDAGTLSAEVIRSGQALLLTPANLTDLPSRVTCVAGTDFLDWLGVPLVLQGEVIGAVVVQSYAGDVRYTVKDKALLQFVSAQVATAIERKQTDMWLHHIARHDPLTDLPNRELFDEHVQCAIERARDNGTHVALLYIDLDRFKQVNDTFGHDIGDLLLREVAQRIRHCVRDSDSVGRRGGDEFVVLVPALATAEHAATIAEKIRISLANMFELAGHRTAISASIGVSLYPRHGSESKALIRHADAAMYLAKKAGGNRFACATESRQGGGNAAPAPDAIA